MRYVQLKAGLLSLLCVTAFAISSFNTAQPQTIDPRRGFGVGVAGQGTDMWTQAMSGLRLFTPHRDDCNATTEVFVKIYNNSNNVDFGFCIDKDEHSSGAKQWEDARQECLDDGKRLPEPGEWKYACDSIAGLNNMTDDWEWTSNFWSLTKKPTSNWWRAVDAPQFGNGSCDKAEHGHIGRLDNVGVQNWAFRCVR